MASGGTKMTSSKGTNKTQNKASSNLLAINTPSNSNKGAKATALFQRKQLSLDNPAQTPPARKSNRRHSVDVGQSSPSISAEGKPTENAAITPEPKSILKQNKPRRSSIAFGDLPHSAEYEQIMSALLSSKISPQDSPLEVDDDELFRFRKEKVSTSAFEEETISEEDAERTIPERYHGQVFSLDNLKDEVSVKKVTFNDEVFCAPDL